MLQFALWQILQPAEQSSKDGITHDEINKQSEIMSLNVSKYLKVVIQAYGN